MFNVDQLLIALAFLAREGGRPSRYTLHQGGVWLGFRAKSNGPHLVFRPRREVLNVTDVCSGGDHTPLALREQHVNKIWRPGLLIGRQAWLKYSLMGLQAPKVSCSIPQSTPPAGILEQSKIITTAPICVYCKRLWLKVSSERVHCWFEQWPH